MNCVEIHTSNQTPVLDGFMETLKRKAEPYFQRGYTAVIERRHIRSFDEAAGIIKARFLEHGIAEELAEPFACVFARSYIAGVIAAGRVVAPELVERFTHPLEGNEQRTNRGKMEVSA